MAFLTLNGIAVPVAPGSGTKRAANLGEYARSYSGTPYSTVRARKVEVVAKTVPLAADVATVYEQLFEGAGDSWTFNTSSLASSRGRLPDVVSGTVIAGSVAGKFSFGLSIDPGAIILWGAVAPTQRHGTLAFWRKEGSVFAHYVIRTIGSSVYQTFKNGVRNDAANPGVAILDYSSGNVILLAPGASTEVVDDLACLPYSVPDDWPAQLYASAKPWGPLPLHAVGGDWLASRCTQALSQWVSSDPVNGLSSGVGSEVSFELYGA